MAGFSLEEEKNDIDEFKKLPYATAYVDGTFYNGMYGGGYVVRQNKVNGFMLWKSKQEWRDKMWDKMIWKKDYNIKLMHQTIKDIYLTSKISNKYKKQSENSIMESIRRCYEKRRV